VGGECKKKSVKELVCDDVNWIQVAGNCDIGKEASVSINGGKCFDYPSEY
jgi:hypothetical protein